MPKTVVSALEQLGFSATDARVYVGLLQGHPATGYDLAKRTRVPRSAIYAVLSRLERAGLVRAVQATPAKYEPLPPQQLVAQLRDRHQETLDHLQEALARLDRSPQTSSLWATVGYDALLREADRLIRGSRTLVAASLWSREAEHLAPAFAAAADAGVEVVLFSFTPLPPIPGKLFSYGIAERDLEQYWPHKLILVSDHHRLLVGNAEESDSSRGTLTDEPVLVEMGLSTLVLDLTLCGQRMGVEPVSAIVQLTTHLAPLEQLLNRTGTASRG
jgi:sugar-specific transcriptional regulator TrmB